MSPSKSGRRCERKRGLGSSKASRYVPARSGKAGRQSESKPATPDIKQMVELVNRTALEVAAEENRLRHLLRELIKQRRTDVALTVLQDWDKMAPGDVLQRHETMLDEEQE